MSLNPARFFGMLILFVGASFIALAATGHIIVFDGSWFLFSSLSTGRPFLQHGRIAYIPFYWLHLFAANHGADVPTCSFLFGLGFDLFTAAVLASGLWLCRNRPVLLCGLLAGPFVGCLPGQIQSFNEATHIGQLGGILILLAAYAPAATLFWFGFVALPFLFFAHPASALTFFAIACLLALRTWLEPKHRGFLSFVGVLVALGAVRASVTLNPYERDELTLAVTIQHFRSSFWGLPLVYVSLAWGGLALLGLRSLFRQSRLLQSKVAVGLAYALLSTFGVGAVVWANDPSAWISALNYRRFSVLLALAPVVVCAVIHVVTANRKPQTLFAAPLWVAAAITITGCVVALQIQGWVFHGLCQRLRQKLLAESRLVTPRDLPWSFMTPLRGWYLPFTALLVQGKAPHSKIVAESNRIVGVAVPEWQFAKQKLLRLDAPNQFFSFTTLAAHSRQGQCLLSVTESESGPELHAGIEGFWVKHQFARAYTFVNSATPQCFHIRFSASTFQPDLPIRVIISATGNQTTNQLVLRNAANAWTAPPEFDVPLELPTRAGEVAVRLESDAEPVTIGGHDTRRLVFLVRNFRIDPPRAGPVASAPTACQFTLVTGWHPREYSGQDWLCWTAGRGQLSVVVTNATVALLTGQILAAQRPNIVAVFVNGTQVATLKIDWRDWEFHQFPDVQCALQPGTNRIEFVSHNPATQLPNDTRLLAVAVKNLTLTTTDR